LGVFIINIVFPIKFLALLLFRSGVVECGRRPTDPNTLAALAAAEQRRQQLHSTREDRRAGLGEDPRPALGTALGATVSVWLCHSAGTGSSSPARGGGFEQPYGAQAFKGAVQKDCNPPELLAHDTQRCTQTV